MLTPNIIYDAAGMSVVEQAERVIEAMPALKDDSLAQFSLKAVTVAGAIGAFFLK